MYSNQNIFITGKAGTGKTTLLEYFRINSKKNFVILASTGISAIKAKGKTIHSFFLFPPRILINEKIKRLRGNLIKNVDTILIDECSMIRCDVLDAIDQSLRLNRNNDEIFGGVQIILLGDIHQLPPVIRENEKDIFDNFYPNGVLSVNDSKWENFKKLNLENTTFANPHGLPNRANLSSAYDIFKLSSKIIKDFPEQLHRFKKTKVKIKGKNYTTHNTLLKKYNHYIGLKYCTCYLLIFHLFLSLDLILKKTL